MYNLLDEAAAATTGTGMGQSWISIVMLLVLVVVFYFFMIRPQKKQEKETNAMRNGLQVGDEVTTIGGIKDETVVIETTHNCTKIRILRTAVRSVDVKAEDAE